MADAKESGKANSKQYSLETEDSQQNKWVKTGVFVAGLNEVRLTYRKFKQKPTLSPKLKQTRSPWTKEKQSWHAGDWMKVIFNDES